MARHAIIYYKENLAGYLSETDEGYTFIYDDNYLQYKDAMPVSLTLPLQSKAYESRVLFSFFDGLIPEGWLLNVAQNYWKLKGNDRFELLLTLCRDAIGAVSILPQEEEVADV
ncbi:HipA N-terminal domain-containing protein [Dyadobacter sp. LJ53]|uniref:HipA N-terminal domain-containing protein n=1 Tax=Dyadobacter chenwenxiniae TaxID=2906456 RepID=UPI001F26052E|nr:HipA N-terminal domain-containing protein [Dyadobacter chenwenxiniae]MCF0049282.1 HipA N-terminal domain-containing protein [Dyadobacter chenwenxiniae]